jgi:hypothetical protein
MSLKVSCRTEEAWTALRPAVVYLLKQLKYVIKYESNLSFLLEMSTDDAEMAHSVLSYHKLPMTLTLDVVYPQ